jgi:predicted nucleotidyltransferase
MKQSLTREKIRHVLRAEMPFLRKKYGVQRIALFGSFARDEQSESSDVDLIVELAEPLGLEFVGLALHLEEKLGCKVDLATLDSLKRSRTNPRYSQIASQVEKELLYV